MFVTLTANVLVLYGAHGLYGVYYIINMHRLCMHICLNFVDITIKKPYDTLWPYA